MKKVNWWIVGVVIVLTALFLVGGGMMWGNRDYGMTLAPGASAGVGGNGYGMMGGQGMMGSDGMMSGWDNTTTLDVAAEMIISPDQAVQYAQQYLDTNYAGATAATDPTQFYGYYTLDFEKDGKIVGMLSVNSYSGQIFLHTWHGTFIEETE